MISRRKLFNYLLVPTGIVLSGCSSRFDTGSISINVINWTENTQNLTLVLRTSSGQKEFEESFQVEPNESKKKTDVAPGGNYELSVSLENGHNQVESIQMNDCSDQEVTVRPESSEYIAIESKNC